MKSQSKELDIEILTIAEYTYIESLIKANKMRCTGHIICMDSQRVPKGLFNGKLLHGKRPQHSEDNIKNNLKLPCQLGL